MINGGSLGALNQHLPWKHDQETVDIYRKYVLLHYQLSPYLFSCSVDANLDKSTIIKHANMEEESHWFGDQLFVKVITDSSEITSVKLPEGNSWIDFWDAEMSYPGGSTVKTSYDLHHYPLFVKSGAIIPVLFYYPPKKESSTLVGKQSTIFMIYPDGRSEIVYHKPTGKGADYNNIKVVMNESTGELNVTADVETDFLFAINWLKEVAEIENADGWIYCCNKNQLKIFKKGKSFTLRIF